MLDHTVTRILGRQYGLIANFQLRDAVPDPDERIDLRRSLGLEPLTTRVLGSPIHPPGPGRGLQLRTLDAGPGGMTWGKTASAWWDFTNYPLSPVHVARLRTNSRPPVDAQLHHLTSIDPIDVTEHRGVRISRPEPTILWLAGMLTHRWPNHPEVVVKKVGAWLDTAWRMSLIDGHYLHDLAERSGGRGRSGIVALRAALETRPPDYLPTGSGCEDRFVEILPSWLQDRLDGQVCAHDETLIGVVDFQLRTWALIIEINGVQWHTAWSDRERDARRYERLLAQGWSVLVWWDRDVWKTPQTVRSETVRIARNADTVPTLHRPSTAPWEL